MMQFRQESAKTLVEPLMAGEIVPGRSAAGADDGAAPTPIWQVLAGFKDPLTRVVLGCDGLTTPMLEAVLAMHLDVRVLRQDVIPGSCLPPPTVESLGLSAGAEMLVRRSCMVGRDLIPASVNYVVGPAEANMTAGVDDIGRALIADGRARHRETLRIGLAEWLDGRPCAAKAYVLFVDGRRRYYIRECYNPDYLSPDSTEGDFPSSWDDEPRSMNVVNLPAAPLDLPVERALQQPEWPDQRVAQACYEQLRGMPPLVSTEQCAELTADLAAAAAGKAFVLHLGDCAETFDLCRTDALNARQALAVSAAAALFYGTGLRAVTVGRIAGQYAKPRSQPIEASTGLPSYRGDMVNSVVPIADLRVPDPNRLITAYLHAAATVNHLRTHPVPPAELSARLIADAAQLCPEPEMATMFHQVAGLLTRVAAVPGSSRQLHSWMPQLHTSHEGLLLPYEYALTRTDPDGGRWDCSTQLLWIGERTRQHDGAHIDFAASIANPVAVKLGPTTEQDDAVALCRRLNPTGMPGRLTFIARMGAEMALTNLPRLMQAVAATGIPAGWICDPMHANTRTVADGRKTRDLEDILNEISAFFHACRTTGTTPTGLHLETAPEPVTECTGGWQGISPSQLATNYLTTCDPRLNAVQALQCTTHAMRELIATYRS